MARKQLPLFPSEPTSQSDISKHTPLSATYDHFRYYLMKEGKSEHTVKAFMGDLKLFAEYVGEDVEVAHFTTTKLNDFLHWMENGRGIPCSRKTYARRVTTIKVYFKWLRHLSAIPHDPAAAVLQRSGPAPLNHALNPKQIQAVILAAMNIKKGEEVDTRPELLFQLLLQTGIKKSETERLSLKDFDRSNPEHPTILLRHKLKDVYKERRLEIEPDLLRLLDEYIEQYKPKETVFTCTTRNLEYILTDLGKIAGIDYKLSFEGMRWSMAVRDYRMGVEEERIREKLGLSQASWYETNQKIKRLAAQQVAEENL